MEPTPDKSLQRESVELRRLQQFVAVVETGSLTEAAHRLRLSQQALSVAVKGLEAQVGMKLFERSRGMKPSAAGMRLYDATKVLLAGADRLVPAVRQMVAEGPEVVSVGHSPAVSSLEVFDTLTDKVPDGVSVHARRLFPSEMRPALMSGSVDIALRRGVSPPDGFAGAVVAYGRLNVAVSVDDPIARLEAVGFADLAALPLILWAPESRSKYAAYLVNQFRSAGFEPRTLVSPFQGLMPVAAPLAVPGGFALVAARPGVYADGRVAVVELKEPVLSPVQALWLPTTQTGAPGDVIERLRDAARPVDERVVHFDATTSEATGAATAESGSARDAAG